MKGWLAAIGRGGADEESELAGAAVAGELADFVELEAANDDRGGDIVAALKGVPVLLEAVLETSQPNGLIQALMGACAGVLPPRKLHSLRALVAVARAARHRAPIAGSGLLGVVSAAAVSGRAPARLRALTFEAIGLLAATTLASTTSPAATPAAPQSSSNCASRPCRSAPSTPWSAACVRRRRRRAAKWRAGEGSSVASGSSGGGGGGGGGGGAEGAGGEGKSAGGAAARSPRAREHVSLCVAAAGARSGWPRVGRGAAAAPEQGRAEVRGPAAPPPRPPDRKKERQQQRVAAAEEEAAAAAGGLVRLRRKGRGLGLG